VFHLIYSPFLVSNLSLIISLLKPAGALHKILNAQCEMLRYLLRLFARLLQEEGQLWALSSSFWDQIPANKKVLKIDDFGSKRGYIRKMHDWV